MSGKSTAVSILMPARNAQRYIAAAIESIRGQTFGDWELIVIDDRSEDDTRRIAGGSGDARVRVVEGPGRGISAALNAGLAAATGPLLARCDADDLYPADRLEKQVAWMSAHGDFAAVCGSFESLTHAGKLVSVFECGDQPAEITAELRTGRTRTHLGTFLTRTEIVRAVGGFREYFVTSEDIDAQLRIGEAGRVWYEPVVAYRYRLHDQSITHNQPDRRRVFYEAEARRLQSQRLRGEPDDLQRGTTPLPPPDLSLDNDDKLTGSSEHVWGILVGRSWREHAAGQQRRALLTGMRICVTRPLHVASWKNLVALMIKRPAS